MSTAIRLTKSIVGDVPNDRMRYSIWVGDERTVIAATGRIRDFAAIPLSQRYAFVKTN